MALRSDAYYRGLVEAELRAAGHTEPPVSPTAVATHLGVPVRTLPLPPWFTAALVYEDGMPAILLNPTRPEDVRRRALGHLLGHLLLVLDDPTATYPRATGDVHREADIMAEEFETPGYLVRDQAQKWFNDYRYLAGLFGVTEERMFATMQELGLIKTRGVIWDY
ncbi:MAG: ImmA/IrrE family metallo-endopeptidase [Coriobacteriia bacterium]|nr:ImmA/IrrE family metallo-endopeptidase [Coriobacteriia bacterium]